MLESIAIGGRNVTDTHRERRTGPAVRGDAHGRIAAMVFGMVLMGAFPLLLGLGHYHWFLLDEWDFLADRNGGDLGDLLRPHTNVHWSTLPIIVYRVLWRLFGLRTYVPYQVVLILLHLTAAFLLRKVMRRAGV